MRGTYSAFQKDSAVGTVALRTFEDVYPTFENLFRFASTMICFMADFLAVLGTLGFAAAMLGLVWALDHV